MSHSQNFSNIPGRDATASIGGYVYQIYQSVFAWLRLNDNDLLVLEGAEDFDIHNETYVVTTQVKHQSKNVTLRSPSILEAIENFWTHQQSNEDFNVAFRFLTTSEAGFEKDVQFDPYVPGIKYWELAATGNVKIEPLRQLLISLINKQELRAFLETSSDEELCERLLSRIHWDLGARDKRALEVSIENKLKFHGDKRGVSVALSIRVLPHLLKYVADVLSTKGKKCICYADFLTEFESATTESISRSSLETMQNALLRQIGSLSKSDESSIKLAAFGQPIPVVSGAIGRKDIIEEIVTKLATTRVIFLHGSSGVGKTNVAATLAKVIGGSWLWASFRGKQSDQIQQNLINAIMGFDGNGPTQVVLDDLDLAQISMFEREFISLIFTIVQSGGQVLITSINKLPLNIFPKLWLNIDSEYLVPYFTEAEISELISTHGLVDTHQKEGWSRVIYLMTSGHPQLVHARVRTLHATGWPSVSTSRLLDKPDDIERVRSEARQRLLQEFPSDSTRLLAYRLSVVIGQFSRKLAISVGSAEPKSISMVGEAFEHLIGPWIEQEGEDKFRVSPLLKGAAESILSPEEIGLIHVAIARDYIGRKILDQYEIGTTFFHAFMAKDLYVLSILAQEIIVQSTKNLALLYDAMPWFANIALESGKKIVNGDITIEIPLRLAQFKLLLSTENKEGALKAIARLDETLDAQSASDDKKMFEAMAYGTVLNTYDLHIPSKLVIRMLSKFMDTATIPMLAGLYEGIPRDLSSAFLNIADNRPEQVLFSYQAARISGMDDLLDLISALEELPKYKRESLLNVCESSLDFANMLVSQAWWNDVKREEINPQKAISILEILEAKARVWQSRKLVISSLISKSVIYNEYMQSTESALAVLDIAEKEFSNNPLLLNQRAKVLFNSDQFEKSLHFAESALACSEFPDVEYVFTCRNAAIAASKINALEKAANFFELGAVRAFESKILTPMGVGLIADEAYVLWVLGDRKVSIEKLAQALEKLEAITITDDIRIHHLHATVRHSISWIHFQALNKDDNKNLIATPLVAMCSNQEPNKDIKDHKVINISAAWLLLYQTERFLKLDCGVKEKANRYDEKDQPFFVASYQRINDFHESTRTPPWDRVVTAYIKVSESIVYTQALKLQNSESKGHEPCAIPVLTKEYWDSLRDWSLISHAFLAACINCLAYHPELKLPLESWRSSLKQLAKLDEGVNKLLDVLNGGDSDGSLLEEVAKGLFKLQRGNVSVQELWIITFRVLNAFGNLSDWEGDVEYLICKNWSWVLENQRFAFSSPALAIPAITNILNDGSLIGYSKVALIAKVSRQYLSLSIHKSGLEMLDRLIQKQE